MLWACCGSTSWVERMLARRPFATREALLEAAREEWFQLTEDDWLEAFRQHPKIGDRDALRERFGASGHLSEKEQSGLAGAADDILGALAAANREYERKFGFIFIVCATGRSAGEMLDMISARLKNDRKTELHTAAAEQARITELRLVG